MRSSAGDRPKSVTVLAIPGRSRARRRGRRHHRCDRPGPPFSFEAERYNLTPLADFATGTDPFPQFRLVVRKELLRSNRDLVKRMLMAYVERFNVLKTECREKPADHEKIHAHHREVIAKPATILFQAVFLPPLTEEKGIAWSSLPATSRAVQPRRTPKPKNFSIIVYCRSCAKKDSLPGYRAAKDCDFQGTGRLAAKNAKYSKRGFWAGGGNSLCSPFVRCIN